MVIGWIIIGLVIIFILWRIVTARYRLARKMLSHEELMKMYTREELEKLCESGELEKICKKEGWGWYYKEMIAREGLDKTSRKDIK